MANRYTNAQTYQGSLYTPPIELVAKAMENLQQRYDKNFTVANEIRNNFIPSLPQDRALANQLQSKYEQQINDAVNSYNGDYSRASKDLERVLYGIRKDYGPGGKANAIISNYQNYQNWVAQSQDLVSKGKALGEDFNVANSYYMNTYTGIGAFDPTSGSYNRFNPETLSEYVNPDEIIQSVYKNFKPQKQKVGRTSFENGKQVYREEEFEGITPDRLYPSFKNALRADPKFYSYVQQRMRFEGTDPRDVEAIWDNYAKVRARDLSYMNASKTEKAERDPLFLLRERQRLRDASDAKLLQQFMPQYQYDPTVDAVAREKADLNLADWKSSAAGAGDPGLSVGPPGSGIFSVPPKTGVSPIKGLTTFSEALNNQEFLDKTKINPHLAQAILEEQKKNLPAGVFEKKYGKDTTWTENFDNRIVAEYKKQEANFSRFQPKSIRIASPEAREQILLEKAAELANPNLVNVYKVGQQGMMSATDAGLDINQILTKDNKLRKDVNVSYVLPGPGYPAAGFKIVTDAGAFILADNDVARTSLSNELAGGFNPIFFENKKQGNPIRIGSTVVDGKPQDVWARPTLDYVPNGNSFDEQLSFDVVRANEKGQLESTGQRLSGRDIDIYNQYLPQFEGALGAGASKKDRTLFSLYKYYANEEN